MINKKLIWVSGLLIVLVVIGAVGATSAFAQSSTSTLEHGRGPGGGGRGLSDAALAAAAEALNMTTDELTAALQSGQTLEQIAEEAGVDFEDVQAAIQAVRETELQERIEQALADGTITQEHADWLLEGLEKGFLSGPGGFGFGGPHGGPRPDGAPPVQPTPSSGG
jgi:hypothetical protein